MPDQMEQRQDQLKVHLLTPFKDIVMRKTKTASLIDLSLPHFKDQCLGILDILQGVDVLVVLLYVFLADEVGD